MEMPGETSVTISSCLPYHFFFFFDTDIWLIFSTAYLLQCLLFFSQIEQRSESVGRGR